MYEDFQPYFTDESSVLIIPTLVGSILQPDLSRKIMMPLAEQDQMF